MDKPTPFKSQSPRGGVMEYLVVKQGHLVRLCLPLSQWMHVVTPLETHPNDLEA